MTFKNVFVWLSLLSILNVSSATYDTSEPTSADTPTPLATPQPLSEEPQELDAVDTGHELSSENDTLPIAVASAPSPAPTPAQTWASWLSESIRTSNSLFLKLFLVFLLGILMSLTPCIYPMIPITAGILQAQASRSLGASFLLALSYATGIATTFACLGLLAAFAGQAMGQFMNNPIFITILVIVLLYLALSMIGLYDIYIPRFLQPRNHDLSGGSFLSAFAFGALSGVVASPCLSPGLVSLLLIVTTLANKLLGFLLLFSFGLGLSIPLLVIGTFSSALTVLPRAGMWMIEIKELFGYLMIGMCLYFLKNIIPAPYINWLITCTLALISGLFLYKTLHLHSRVWQFIYTCIGILILSASVLFWFQASFLSISQSLGSSEHQEWSTNYQEARQHALDTHKPLFIDIGAPYCSICKAIDTTLFADPKVQEALTTHTVPVKIDGSVATNKELLQHYNVLGFPTILLIDPETGAVLKKWGPELYNSSAQEFIAQLKQ